MMPAGSCGITLLGMQHKQIILRKVIKCGHIKVQSPKKAALFYNSVG